MNKKKGILFWVNFLMILCLSGCSNEAKQTNKELTVYIGFNETNKACFLSKWRNKLVKAMQPYFMGEMSYEECIKQAKEQVEFYLSE